MSNGKLTQEKPIPSHYLSIDRQIEILKAFAVYYGKNNKGATYKEIANILSYDKNQVSSSLKFWKDIGLLTSDKATYVPTQYLLDFNQKIQWGGDVEAWKSFRVAINESWFVDQIKMKFQIKKSAITRDELTKSLGVSSGAVSGDKNKQKSISILIDLLENCGVIIKGEDGTYTINSDAEETTKKLVVDESKEMVQVKIGSEIYAVDLDKIKNFVQTNGKKIDSSIQKIG